MRVSTIDGINALASILIDGQLLGNGAIEFGSPDLIIMNSGGPASHLANNSLLCGPSNTRIVIKQPSLLKTEQKYDALSGEIVIDYDKLNFTAEIEEWKHGCWYHANIISAKSLADLFNKLTELTPNVDFLLNDDEIVSAMNSFIGFRVLANASGNKIHWVPMNNYRYDLESMANKINDYTKIVYIANPDNPMGTYITREEFDTFYSYVPDRVLIILDEAYFEYAESKEDYPDSMTYRYDNVITLRSFSKAYGLGGVRIGYGFAHDELINNLLKVKVPFEPSTLAQIAGHAALDDSDFLLKTIETNREGVEYLKKQLKAIGVKYIPSIANFITTIWESESRATQLTEKLLRKGVIVRQLNSFGWPTHIRISIGLEKENQGFIKLLKEVL